MKKETRTERVEITIDGIVYTGTRIITGTRKLFQTISYNGDSRNDSKAYQNNTSLMEVTAKIILGELVRESKRQ